MEYIDPADAIFTIGAALFTTLLTEGVSWLLIYRTDEYKRLNSEVRIQTKKIEKMKE